MKDLISVIITCYNHEKYIKQCINSVFLQTYKNIELLVLNDGSTDNSGKIIEELLPSSPFKHTEYKFQTNAGVCVTRNKGIEWAKGEFILFVDSDNYLDNDFIEKLIFEANHNHADIIYSDLFNVETQNIFMEAKEYNLESFLKSNYIDNCSLIRTSKIGTCRYDIELNRKKLVDYDFIMSLVLVNGALPRKCYHTKLNYRVLETSISRIGDHETEKFYFEVYLYILSKYLDEFPTEVMQGIKDNMVTLTSRIMDLIQHLDSLSNHINNQENDILVFLERVQNLENEVNVKLDKEKKLNAEKIQLTNENQYLNNMVSIITMEKNQLLNSKSFKIGNFFVKPLSYGIRAIKKPQLIIKALLKIKLHVIKKVKKMPNPKTIFLRYKRSIQRNKNNYKNPKRLLIFVVYEEAKQLHDYKLYFLKALAKSVDEILIVVNGNLPENDIQVLSKIGRVELRPNKGYDTAAFLHGIRYFGKEKLTKYDELLLVNDTNVGPISDFSSVFSNMAEKKLDFWGISYGEEQNDFTKSNKYGFIPVHLQSYFLVIEKSLLSYSGFYDYWESLEDTDSRDKAIANHETIFTKHFSDLGFKHGALTEKNVDSPMYIHPLKMVKEGVPLIKYAAFSNYDNDQFKWQGLIRESEIPELIDYIKVKTNYPVEIIDQIISEIKNKKKEEHILIIDGVENAIPQLTKYRVENKVEQLQDLGYDVLSEGISSFQMKDAKHASHIIIYRAPLDSKLIELIHLCKKSNKLVLYDIDDLVIDTKYTDQLSYVQGLSASEKQNYDSGVINYGEMLKLCDGAVVSTKKMQDELYKYKDLVFLNRNLANKELVDLSQKVIKNYHKTDEKISLGYFSGSITHNENFELIKPALIRLLEKYDNLELHLVGHLDLPNDIKVFANKIKMHSFVDWRELPQLISEVDINLAPLVNSIFNEAKSEIKWIEAALVKVPTIASNIGAFKEMIIDNETGILVSDANWFEKLDKLIQSKQNRQYIADKAYEYVMSNTCTLNHEDELTKFLRGKNNHD